MGKICRAKDNLHKNDTDVEMKYDKFTQMSVVQSNCMLLANYEK